MPGDTDSERLAEADRIRLTQIERNFAVYEAARDRGFSNAGPGRDVFSYEDMAVMRRLVASLTCERDKAVAKALLDLEHMDARAAQPSAVSGRLVEDDGSKYMDHLAAQPSAVAFTEKCPDCGGEVDDNGDCAFIRSEHEERDLTIGEQAVMKRALQASTRLVAEGAATPDHAETARALINEWFMSLSSHIYLPAPDSITAAELVARIAAATRATERAAYERVAQTIRQMDTPGTLTNDQAFGWEHCRDKAALIARALAAPDRAPEQEDKP